MNKIIRILLPVLVFGSLKSAFAQQRPDDGKFHAAFDACVAEGIEKPAPGVRSLEMDACLETKGISAPPAKPEARSGQPPRDPASEFTGNAIYESSDAAQGGDGQH